MSLAEVGWAGPLGRNGFKPRARRVETVKESDLPDPHFHWSAYG
ncbi:hypothetical protein [Planobispora longispora]|nr:hypothetical protein [Planobispora longispora]